MDKPEEMDNSLQYLGVKLPGAVNHFDELQDPLTHPKRKIAIQLIILKTLGLTDFGLLDFKLHNRFFLDLLQDALSTSDDISDFRLLFAKQLGRSLFKQIESSGTTIRVNIDSEHVEIIRLVPRILDLRKREIQDIHLPVFEQEVDLRPLWLTAYGLQSLQALQVKTLFVDIRDPTFCDIDTVFSDLGFPLKTGDEDRAPITNMSDSMQDFILEELAMSPVSHEDRIRSILHSNPDLSSEEIARLAKVPIGQVTRLLKRLKR